MASKVESLCELEEAALKDLTVGTQGESQRKNAQTRKERSYIETQRGSGGRSEGETQSRTPNPKGVSRPMGCI